MGPREMSKLIRLIGDVHGKYEPYKRLIAGVSDSVQLGDMGAGFRRTNGQHYGDYYANPPYMHMMRGNHRFIRGNHDNPAFCRHYMPCIADGTIENGVMFIGGGLSVDKALRMPDFTWWEGEECSAAELMEFTDTYIKTRPRAMLTHDCPEEIAVELERLANRGKLDPRFASRTRQAFQSMWSAHSPELWVFGHWHKSFDQVCNGTRFICLAELEPLDIEL